MRPLRVFDLQRFALHDGPGIRTTVFLKGCPLDCIWCHNPESKKAAPQLRYMNKKCSGCRKCSTICTKGVHSFTQEGRHVVDFDKCSACGKCTGGCLTGALSVYGKEMKTSEIMNIVSRDRDFYRTSGGGLTVSGGEPMSQFDGLLELLKAAKQEGFHVCLDTSGYAPAENYLRIAPYVDLFLYDMKIADREKHKKYTCVYNDLILSNLDLLCREGAHMILRCPIIPGINNEISHYRAIAELSRKYETIDEVNLMTYHDMAKGKAAQIGGKYELSELKTIEEEEKYSIYEQAEACGCVKLGMS